MTFKTTRTSSMPVIGLALASAALLGSAAHAASSAPDVYLGGGLAFNRTHNLSGDVDASLAAQGLGSSSTSDSASTNPSVRLGLRISPNISLEASYDKVGTMNLQSAISTPGADSAAGTWKSHGLGLHVLAGAPIDDKWSVYGRLGVVDWHTTLHLASTSGGSTGIANTNTHLGAAYGVGSAYAVSRNVDATAELVHYNGAGDIASTGRASVNQLDFGLRYHFL